MAITLLSLLLACAAADGDDTRNRTCQERGFNPEQLMCKTCRILKQRGDAAGVDGKALYSECFECCHDVEKFPTAKLICDASSQERDQDLHDFIKRKAPHFPGLEVEYLDGANAAIEFERESDPDKILRADVSGWQSDHVFEFLTERMEKSSESESAKDGIVTGAWTAEIQTCSG